MVRVVALLRCFPQDLLDATSALIKTRGFLAIHPFLNLMRLQLALLQEAADGAGIDCGQDALTHDGLGKLAVGPVSDGNALALWRGSRQGHDVNPLFHLDAIGTARAGEVFEQFLHRGIG